MNDLAKRLNDMACTANSCRSNDAVDALMMEAASEMDRHLVALDKISTMRGTNGADSIARAALKPR